MPQQSRLRFLEERKVGVGIVTPSTVGWAKALARPSTRKKDFRAPCPPSASMQGAPPMVGTAYERRFVVENQCHRLCPPYGACICLSAVLLLAAPARADDVADF